MSQPNTNLGTLESIPDGNPIPLTKYRLCLGRRESCDILLNFGNVSGYHALLQIHHGYWFICDLRSRNGVRVDGKRIDSGLVKRLDPNMVFAIAKHEFVIRYDPTRLGASGTPPPDEQLDGLFNSPGLEPGGAMEGIRPWDSPKKPSPLGGAANPPDDEE